MSVGSRQFKVGRTHQSARGGPSPVRVPLIRLSGKWLEAAGFREGANIEVSVVSREILLRVQGAQSSRERVQRELF